MAIPTFFLILVIVQFVVITKGATRISEVAARPPGAQFTTLLSYAHDLDFYDAWARLMVHEEFTPPRRSWAVGALFLRARSADPDPQVAPLVKRVHGLDAARKELGSLVVEARLPEPGTPRGDTYEGEGYVILRHEETETVEAGLQRLSELVHIEST